MLVAWLVVQVVSGRRVRVGGRPLRIGWLHAGVTIATIGLSLAAHIIRRWYRICKNRKHVNWISTYETVSNVVWINDIHVGHVSFNQLFTADKYLCFSKLHILTTAKEKIVTNINWVVLIIKVIPCVQRSYICVFLHQDPGVIDWEKLMKMCVFFFELFHILPTSFRRREAASWRGQMHVYLLSR